jgi:pyruvate dehydrogenase E1 component alpha subunit
LKELFKEYKGWTAEKLDDFEDDIRQCFLDAKIRSPIHLSKGNSEILVNLFAEYDIGNESNWIFTTHRNHFSALLKGIPKEWLKEQILKGNSMHIMSPEYKFFSSSIVGGSLPIAVGVALSLKRKQEKGHVWCFLGDMAAESGIFHECQKYASNFSLPITFVIEDNGLSTNTPSCITWGWLTDWNNDLPDNVLYYKYTRNCEHINCGVYVEFK